MSDYHYKFKFEKNGFYYYKEMETGKRIRSHDSPYNEKMTPFDNPNGYTLFPSPHHPHYTLKKDIYNADDVGIYSDAIYVSKY